MIRKLLVLGLLVFLASGGSCPKNGPPLADAGADQTVTVGETVTLDGTESSDPDGDRLTFSWELSSLPDGSEAALTGASSATASFVPDVAGTYVAVLTVSDGEDNATDDVAVEAGSQLEVITIYEGDYGQVCRSLASDGASFLVAIQGQGIFDPDSHGEIALQLVNASGALVGGLVDVGWTGGAPIVAYGASRYLVVGGSDMDYPASDLWGVFVSTSGVHEGAPFEITSDGENDEFQALASDGEDFLAVHMRVDGNTWTRTVSSSGVVGPEMELHSGGNPDFGSLAYGDGNYLIVWPSEDGTAVMGRLVSAAGVPDPAGEITILTGASQLEYAFVTFDGLNFLVVSQAGNGQLVASDGTLVGAAFSVPGVPFAFDGSHYLLMISVETTPGNWDVRYQFMTVGGTLLGAPLVLAAGPGNQFPASAAFGGGQFLAVWHDGFMPGGWENGDVFGALIEAP